MASSPDWAAGYRAGLDYAWAHPRLRRPDVWTTDQELGIPEGSSADYVAGWRQALWARH